jgi:farnesyl-diphosphate farnesyltransferase
MDKSYTRLNRLFSSISSSFYLSSKLLPSDIQPINVILYLMARAADTIEDCKLEIDEKREYFGIYKRILNDEEPDKNALSKMAESKHADLSKQENDLIISMPEIMSKLSNLNEGIKGMITAEITEMMTGMEEFLERRILTFEDQNEYCHYVAGTVGEALTNLYYVNGNISKDVMNLLNENENFALALQKVNMIRGIKDDYNNKNKKEANRVYVPQTLLDSSGAGIDDLFNPTFKEKSLIILEELVVDCKKHFKDSIEYLTTIPLNQSEIRKFSSAILFASLKMLIKLKGNYSIFSKDKEVALSLWDKIVLFKNSGRYATDDVKLREYHSKLMSFLY